MAQFDVYRGAAGKGFLLDCQSDLISDLTSRVVVPLMPASGLPKASRLNPVFVIEGEDHVMSTQLIFAIPRDRLTSPVANLQGDHFAIVSALDLLWSGV